MPVEDRREATLLPIIREWIESGTLTVSDCWKSYSKLFENGYLHETVNHSKEFGNSNGFNTNKQEGHSGEAHENKPANIWNKKRTFFIIFSGIYVVL